MTSVSRRKIVYWLCLGVYLIGVLSYLMGLGAFTEPVQSDARVVEHYGKETVAPPTADAQLEGMGDSTSLFSQGELAEIVLGIGAMIFSILVMREIETNRHFLTAA